MRLLLFEETHAVSNPATASPVVDKERVYVYFSSYGLMTFSHDGEASWTAPLAMPKTHHGSGASPVLAGDLLIINHDAMSGGYLLAVDRRTGKEVWKQMVCRLAGASRVIRRRWSGMSSWFCIGRA